MGALWRKPAPIVARFGTGLNFKKKRVWRISSLTQILDFVLYATDVIEACCELTITFAITVTGVRHLNVVRPG